MAVLDFTLKRLGLKPQRVSPLAPVQESQDKPEDIVRRIDEHIADMEARALSEHSIADDVSRLRSLAQALFPRDYPIPEQKNLHRTIFDMPVNPIEAIVQMGVLKVVNKRLLNHWYKDRLVFLICAEKSSSTLHEIIIAEILKSQCNIQSRYTMQRGIRYGSSEMASEASIHGLVPMYVPDGGVIRGSYLPFPGNYRYSQYLGGNKIIFLTRHPADRMVARACMRKNSEHAAEFIESLEQGKAFDSILHGQNNASLRYNLEWMAGWLQARGNHANLYTIRYEDMMAAPRKHFNGIYTFLTGREMDDKTWKIIQQDKMPETKAGGILQPGATEGRVYPRGYSGKVGVWKDYLNDREIAEYNEIVTSFLKYHPAARLVTKLYPDIIIKK